MTLRGRWALVALLALPTLCLLALTGHVAAEPAAPSLTIEMLDAEGHPESLAGAHPDLLRIKFALGEQGGSFRDLEIDLPPGLQGSSDAVPKCPRSVYESEVECPPESQVGLVRIPVLGGKADLPLFQIEPLPGEVLAIGSRPSFSLPLTTEIRPDDFGVTLAGHELPKGSLSSGEFELWGVPADHQEGTSIPRRPFLTTPTECGPVVFNFRMRTWAEGAEWASASGDSGASLTGCEELAFEPQLHLDLSDPVADSPTGLRIDLEFPREGEGSERAPAPVKSATIHLPRGLAVSPGGAEDLVACTDEQLGLGSDAPAHCPDSARIGSAEIVSDALGGSLSGAIYIGAERPGERVRSFLVVPAPGFTLKFVSAMRVDPATGGFSTVMQDLPAAPIQRIRLAFDGGPKALFATPLSCGPVSATARFTPHGGGPSVDSAAPAQISAIPPAERCAQPAFSPQLLVASSSPRAGAPTSISTTVSRRPGEQLLRSFSSTLPDGVGARLGTVALCPSEAASVGNCPPESRIGTALASIGSGRSPAVVSGDVYLTGPYHGAPFATLTRFQGQLGPLNLGAITSRAALELNPRNGKLTATTSAIPAQVEGIQVRFQRIELTLNRPGLLRNPTSCSPGDALATFESSGGDVATASSPFSVRGCHRLGFRPRVRVGLVGRRQLKEHGTPTLRVTMRLREGDSNLRAMRLVLPSELKLGTGRLKELCSRPDAARGTCPSGSQIGFAAAKTPLVKGRLRGGMYMAQPDGDGLPDLWMMLAGAGLRTDLKGRSASIRGGRYVSALSGLPDTPITSLSMRMGGDSKAVSLRVDPCRRTARHFFVQVEATAQNGRRRSLRAPIAVRGCPGEGR